MIQCHVRPLGMLGSVSMVSSLVDARRRVKSSLTANTAYRTFYRVQHVSQLQGKLDRSLEVTQHELGAATA